MRILKTLFFAATLLFSLPAAALTATSEEVIKAAQAAGNAYRAKDYAAYQSKLEELIKLRPNSPGIMLRLASAYALNDHKSQALDILVHMVAMGFAYDIGDEEDFNNLHGLQAFDYVVEQMKNNMKPFGDSTLAFTAPQKDILAEGLAYDPKSGDFFVSSVRKGEILRVTKDGKVTEFVHPGQDGLWGVFGMKVDTKRSYLWAASSALAQNDAYAVADYGRAGIFQFDLKSGKLIRKYILPAGGAHVLGDLILASNGDVYASDSVEPVVFIIKSGSKEIEPLFEAKEFVNLQGLTLTPDEKKLILADYHLGLFVVDLEAHKVYQMAVPRNVSVGGIDGIYFYKGGIIAVQNGVKPPRIVRFDFNDDFTAVTGTAPIEANNPHFDDPSLGVLVKDEFYYIANSQWPHFPQDGSISDPEGLKPVTVLKVNVKDVSAKEWRNPIQPVQPKVHLPEGHTPPLTPPVVPPEQSSPAPDQDSEKVGNPPKTEGKQGGL